MPKNTNILMVRHAEKPDSGWDLSVAGQERAHAYAIYFQNYILNGTLLELDYIVATADSSQSHRPRLTMEPLAEAMGMEINAKYEENDYQKLADHILQSSKYDQSNILICWHHGEILELAAALGVDATTLPAESHWPSPPWPGEVFGWLLHVCYDADGNVIPSQTVCINQQLMYDDYGKNPPTVG
jgi:phosphohistidine phosphatase SixA